MRKIFSTNTTKIIAALVIITLCVVISQKQLKNSSPTNPATTQKEITSTYAGLFKELMPDLVGPPLSQYIEIMDSCGPYYVGDCVNVRSGPGTKYTVIARLRTGVVLRVSGIVTNDEGGWYKIQIDKNIKHPERITGDWFVAVDNYIRLFTDVGDQQLFSKKELAQKRSLSTKRIVIDISKERLYAYDGNELFMEEPISTGLDYTPTPNGQFTVYKKTPSRYMQGPEQPGSNDRGSEQYYDLPGVPWDLYFTSDGDVIHGTYWHDHFGEPWSHGCVNLPTDKAKKLYQWTDIGTPVTVQR